MESGQIIRLHARSKIALSLAKEALVSAGGVSNTTGFLFPLHPRSVEREHQKAKELWLPVEETVVELAAPRHPHADHSPQEKSSFNASLYFQSLESDFLGQAVLFAQRIPSTVHIVDRLAGLSADSIGIVAVAAQQTSGKGRTGNVWESPLGCAMFSFPLTIPLSSKLGQGLTFVQHLVATACVLGVRNTPGFEDVDLRIKWPNDILTSDKIKVGGVLVTSSIFRDKATCNVGIGVNISNSEPTTCLNDLICATNESRKTKLEPFTIERFIARTLTELERLLKSFAALGAQAFLPTYLKYWLHMNQEVNIQLSEDAVTDSHATTEPTEQTEQTTGQIVGLDEHGFLQVKVANGEQWSVQSDGNRFDMMANLLRLRKIS
ncbi:Biotin--protein ligase [Hypsibius exemplaris]|uniref:Biotin--protein ligase n=1 Tax=Hypsibius exemplaris TaxID=2072580 RepID=A0A9X6NCA7_HYPEX|nr:Biotin--protein ligase [Hypsibius exemplaris]